jgi:ABC-2 type transport system permease protein
MSVIPTTLPAPSLAASSAVIAKRTWIKFIRTPQLVVVGTIQGALFLLMFRYVFGGAINSGSISYVNFLVPGFITASILFGGMGAAAGIAEDRELGLFDRLRSLPIPRSAVLSGRAVADVATQTWGLAVMTIIGFVVGFRLAASVGEGLIAFALIILYTFALEWVFITLGLYARNAQAAQGMSLMLIPFVFISSAFVPVSSMPSGLHALAEHQPVTYMVNAVRALTQGPQAEALLGHSAEYFVVSSLLWSVVLVGMFAPIAIRRYRQG